MRKEAGRSGFTLGPSICIALVIGNRRRRCFFFFFGQSSSELLLLMPQIESKSELLPISKFSSDDEIACFLRAGLSQPQQEKKPSELLLLLPLRISI